MTSADTPASLVCTDTTFEGQITLGKGNILQPRCVVDARLGPIIIGSNNIIEETAMIVHPGGTEPLVIGDGNHICIGAQVKGSLGSGNVVQEKGPPIGPLSPLTLPTKDHLLD